MWDTNNASEQIGESLVWFRAQGSSHACVFYYYLVPISHFED